MKEARRLKWALCVAAAVCVVGGSANGADLRIGRAWCEGPAERPDPRVRTYVTPMRVLWTGVEAGASGRVERAELFLEPRHGQVCEGAFGTGTGCALVNEGGAPGVLLDFGRELHGGLQLGMSPKSKSGARVRLRFGESASEAMGSIGVKNATNNHALRDFVVSLPSFGSFEVGQTGFRFVRIDLVSPGRVGFEFVRAVSLMRPLKAIGFFRSSDERLNRVFDTALRTVHLCCQEYVWDGIKRDRLVWMGDLHPETMALLGVFGAVPAIPETLDYMAATTSPDKWMDGMPTYTLWWIRNLAEWHRFTGDRDYVLRHADYLEKTFDHVLSSVSPDGSWTASPFLDWPTRPNRAACTAGTQALAILAARDTSFLADAAGRGALAEKARRMAEGLARLRPDPCGAKSAAALLALSGLRTPDEMYATVLGRDGHAGLSTFFGYYMIEAMSAAGQDQRALDTVRDYWGGMLDVGATSFWEDFNLAWTNNCFRIDELPVPGKADIHGDYGDFCYKGFRHSLCHGWSGGPVPWCLNHVLGIRAIGTGCRRFEIRPFLGDLSWAEGACALPDGKALRVRTEKGEDGSVRTTVDAPPGVETVVLE